MSKSISGFLFVLSILISQCIPTYAADRWESRTFEHPFSCGQSQYIIRSICEVDTDIDHDVLCNDQRLIKINENGKSQNIDLQAKIGKREESKYLEQIACVSFEKMNYIDFILGTGGNCNQCEASGILSEDGDWVKYHSKWFIPANQRGKYKIALKKALSPDWMFLLMDDKHRVLNSGVK